MLENLSNDQWKQIGVSLEEVSTNLDKWKGQFIELTEGLDTSTLSKMAEILETPSSSKKSETVRNIVENSSFVILACLMQFQKVNKITIIREFLSGPIFLEKFGPTDSKDINLLLLEVFLQEPGFLQDIGAYHDFRAIKNIDEYICDFSLKDDVEGQICDGVKGIERAIKRKYKRKFIYIRSFSDGNSSYHAFQREKETKIRATFGKKIPITYKSDLFVKASPKQNRIEFRCGDTYVRKLVAHHLQSKLGIQLVYDMKKSNFGNIKKILLTALTEKPSPPSGASPLILTRINFGEVNINACVACILGEPRGKDIRPALAYLHENNLVDLSNINNIKSFHISVDDKSCAITIKNGKDGLIFRLDTKQLPAKFRNALCNRIKNELGITVDTFLLPPRKEKMDLELLNGLLHYTGRRHLGPEENDFLDCLKDQHLVNTKYVSVWKCSHTDGHIFHEAHHVCPECEAPITRIVEYRKSVPNYPGIKKFVVTSLKDIFGEANVKKRQKTYYGNTYTFFEIGSDAYTFYVYVDEGHDIKGICEHFVSSFMPVVIVSIRKMPKGIIKDNILPTVTFADFYFKERQKNIIQTIEKLKSTFFTRLESSSNSSKKRLNDLIDKKIGDYDDESFEDDIFNILRYVFGTGEKWGRMSKGKTVPEGVIGYSTSYKRKRKKFKTSRVSFIWDCKYSKEGTIDFGDAELKRQARDYVQRANQSDIIKNFSGSLNSYITFTNSVDLNQYNGFSEWIYGYKTWGGSVILFDISAILKIYDYFVANSSELKEYQEYFLFEFSKAIERSNTNYVHIDNTLMDQIILNTNKLKETKSLDIPRLKEYLISNKVY